MKYQWKIFIAIVYKLKGRVLIFSVDPELRSELTNKEEKFKIVY